ncbi:hypothetical protein B0H14DRAFT_3427054 [Mycena olivaceomarginata]|nr:hypothetical protein B0H14DRAFT_3427054 [Mycena olivaceomarginata]
MDLEGIPPPYLMQDPLLATPEGPPPVYRHLPLYEDIVRDVGQLGEAMGVAESPMAQNNDIGSLIPERKIGSHPVFVAEIEQFDLYDLFPFLCRYVALPEPEFCSHSSTASTRAGISTAGPSTDTEAVFLVAAAGAAGGVVLSLDVPRGSYSPSPSALGPASPAPSTVGGLTRLTTSINSALFANELEYLYTGQQGGDDCAALDGEELRIDKLHEDLVFVWRSLLYSDVRWPPAPTTTTTSTTSRCSSFRRTASSSPRTRRTSNTDLVFWLAPAPAKSLKDTSRHPHLHAAVPALHARLPPLHLGFLYTGTLVFFHRTYDLTTVLAPLLSAFYLALPAPTPSSAPASSPRWRTTSSMGCSPSPLRTARPAYARARPAPQRRRPAEIKELKTLPIDVEARMQRRAVKRQSEALTDEDSDEEWAGTILTRPTSGSPPRGPARQTARQRAQGPCKAQPAHALAVLWVPEGALALFILAYFAKLLLQRRNLLVDHLPWSAGRRVGKRRARGDARWRIGWHERRRRQVPAHQLFDLHIAVEGWSMHGLFNHLARYISFIWSPTYIPT